MEHYSGFPDVQEIGGNASETSRETIGNEVRELAGIFRGRLRTILGVAACVVLMMLAFFWITTPLYSSKVEILVDPRQKQTVTGEIAPTGLGSSAVGADTLLLDSQVEVIRSQSVIGRIVREDKLIEDPEFVGTQGWLPVRLAKSILKTIIYGPHGSTWTPTNDYDRAVEKLSKRLTIERERSTYVIGITMLSWDAEKAARIANKIAAIYIAETNTAASSFTLDAATKLDSRLTELQAAAKSSAEAVETYKTKMGLIGSQDVLVVEQQLRDLNDQLGRARVDKQTAQAILNQVKAAGSPGSRIDPRIVEIAQSQVMSQLQMRLADLDAEEASLLMAYLPRHPLLVRLRETKASLQSALAEEYQRIVSRLQVNYNSANEKEQALSKQLATLEGRMASSNADSVQLRELQREAEASRSVYETFLNRSKEAWEQVDLPKSTARIISTAYPSSRPAYPPVPLLLAGSVVLGLMLGFAWVWLSHVLRPTQTGRGKPAVVPVPSMPEPLRPRSLLQT
jgi:succinoglycan biosynthesis transport protein ExoP